MKKKNQLRERESLHKKEKANKQKESCEKSNERSKKIEEKGELEGIHNEKKKSDAYAKGELSVIEVKQERNANFYAKEKDVRKALLLR